MIPHHLLPLACPEIQVMQAEHVKALAGALPPLERLRQWGLAYSTKVGGGGARSASVGAEPSVWDGDVVSCP